MTDLWNLPFKGDDLADNDFIYWHPATHAGGIQKHGYDLVLQRFGKVTKQWSEFKGDGAKNSDFYLYGTPVYAMQDGKVIAGWRNAPENPVPGTYHEEITAHSGDKSRIYGGGNGLWVEHADGSRVEYAHFQPGTVPSSLCPHNDKLLPLIDSSDVTKAWPHIRVPPGQQATIKKGQFLGRVGNSGTSSHPHLHIHREQGGQAGETKSGGEAVPIHFSSGLSAAMTSDGPHTTWTSFAGQPIPPGPVLIWPSRNRSGEHGRHGQSLKEYGLYFLHFADSGLWPEWIDLYSVNGNLFVNHIWRPAKAAWRAYAGLDVKEYQQAFDDNKAEDFYPVFVESATSGGKPFYAAVFVHNKTGAYLARHGLTYDQHMQEMAAAAQKGLSPISISVVSLGGQRVYTVLYRANGVKNWVIKSQTQEGNYQAEYDKQAAEGRVPVYLCSYAHGGKPYIAAVFAPVASTNRKDRHLMSGSEYQTEYQSATGAGMSTWAVTSFDNAKSQHRYAATWWK